MLVRRTDHVEDRDRPLEPRRDGRGHTPQLFESRDVRRILLRRPARPPELGLDLVEEISWQERHDHHYGRGCQAGTSCLLPLWSACWFVPLAFITNVSCSDVEE